MRAKPVYIWHQSEMSCRWFFQELLAVTCQKVEDEEPGAGGWLEDIAPDNVVPSVDQIFPRFDPVPVISTLIGRNTMRPCSDWLDMRSLTSTPSGDHCPVQVIISLPVQPLMVAGSPHHLPPLPHQGVKGLLLRRLWHLRPFRHLWHHCRVCLCYFYTHVGVIVGVLTEWFWPQNENCSDYDQSDTDEISWITFSHSKPCGRQWSIKSSCK